MLIKFILGVLLHHRKPNDNRTTGTAGTTIKNTNHRRKFLIFSLLLLLVTIPFRSQVLSRNLAQFRKLNSTLFGLSSRLEIAALTAIIETKFLDFVVS